MLLLALLVVTGVDALVGFVIAVICRLGNRTIR
jgi:hypothetical protein